MAKQKEKFKTRGDVFDNFTVRNLFRLESQGHFLQDTMQPISIGKEANIFSASKQDGQKVIVKIYRLETCDFNKMYDYLKMDPGYKSIPRRRRQVIFSWALREFRNLMHAREVIRVPTPITCLHNILVMEHIGDDNAAPKLKDVHLEKPLEICDEVIAMMKKYYGVGFVHGDLSEFNILIYREHPVFIDFSQSCSLKVFNSIELLERDVRNIKRFFGKYKVRLDEQEMLDHISKK